MASAPSTYTQFMRLTGPSYLTGPEDIVNEAVKQTYLLGRMLRGTDIAKTLQGGADIRDEVLFDEQSTYQNYHPNEVLTPTNPQTGASWTAQWRYGVDHMSWTDQEIGQVLYPSHGFGSSKGVLVGYFLDFKRTMVDRPAAERQRLALEQGARIHPQYTTEFETAFSVSWPRVPWNRGSWRSESPAALQALAALRQPDGRVHFAGDYMTNLSSFMQGAFESAREVATTIHKRALARG